MAVLITVAAIYSTNITSDTLVTEPKVINFPIPDKTVMSLTENAIQLYKETGADNTFNEITFGNDHLVDEFYVFVVNEKDATIVAHGGNATRIGYTLENQDNNPVRDIIMTESSPTGKWVKYSWTNPVTEETQLKKSFIKTHDGYIFGSGYYLTPAKDTMDEKTSDDITITDSADTTKNSEN